MEHLELKTESAHLFAIASGKYPTSLAAQAAFIAQSLHFDRRAIKAARKELLNQPDDIEAIVAIALIRHQSLPPERQPVVTVERTKKIISSDFSLASQIAILSPEEVTKILTDDFNYFIETNRHSGFELGEAESEFRQKVLRLIRQRRKETILWGIPWKIHELLEKRKRK